MIFKQTPYISEIVEESHCGPVIIFKYSSECGTSTLVEEDFKKAIRENKITAPVYKVTVQTQPALSQNISDMFEVKHESPQVLVVERGKIIHTAHHLGIDMKKIWI